MALDDPPTKRDLYYIACMLLAAVFSIGTVSTTGPWSIVLWSLSMAAFSLGMAVEFDGMNRRLWERVTGEAT